MRPSSFKKGGGYLNEVDATIVGYTFEAGEEAVVKRGARKGETFTPLSFIPQFEVDGDDESKNEPKTQRLLIGDADSFGDVEEDGQVLSTPNGFPARSEAGIFIASLCDGGFPDTNFDDNPEVADFRPMIGTRVRLVQEVNADKTKWQGKDGKLHDHKDLKVATVHALPEDASPNTKGKGTAKSTKPATGKAGKAAKEPEVDIAELAIETLKDILGNQKDGTIAKSKLSMAVLKTLMKDPNREAVREWLFDDDNLEGIDGVTYNKKKGTITIDE